MLTFSLMLVLFLEFMGTAISKICHEQKAQILSKHQQNALVEQELKRCFTDIKNQNDKNSRQCGQVWDGIMCWPPVEYGTTSVQQCPSYIHKVKPDGFATRRCLESGDWFVHPELNKTWTNYSGCVENITDNQSLVPDVIQEHMPRIQIFYNFGYGISLISLLVAVILMIYFRKLHCQRNTVHINMFISFILRSIICFIKDIDITPEVYNSTIEEETTFGQASICKSVYVIFYYVLTANFMWIFVEGLFLHTFVLSTKYNVSRRLYRTFLILGWCVPLLSVIPWVIVRYMFENTLCWNTMDKGFFWIIKGPIMVTCIINLVFFINIIRVLYTKLNAAHTKDPNKYRKLARSTLVLIPLFGVYYAVFIAVPICMDPKLEVIWMYSEMFFNSFQGFAVALLFCFMNGEVQREIKKHWRRRRIMRCQSNMSSRLKTFVTDHDTHHTCIPDTWDTNGNMELKELTIPMCNVDIDLNVNAPQGLDENLPILKP
ncbi:parathyroid hormone/parathyroid hormone-related peptide receptor-like [Mytilus californianus]|uniref:parathyroid hormone/parathyroid hormone-related peptide receptor-like n=1 Tax=Mytilus californianus TaxID=6549 RepID=UPI002247AA99|nr:parathyroid hormone/parathyroid hormone-related peptide receptor-like [Mytilus californianus]